MIAIACVACREAGESSSNRDPEPPVTPLSPAAAGPPDARAPADASADAAAPVDATPQPLATPSIVAPPAGLVDLRARLPQLRFSIGYATADNFTGAPLPGYEAPGAWAHPDVAAALSRADAALAALGHGLLVFDAYRPRRATLAMVEWTRRNHRDDLLDDGYIAARSQHNRGLAIDLTLTDRTTGTPRDLGGAWDTFDRTAGAFAATGEPDARRRLLRRVMIDAGFVPHDGEWWHFALRRRGAPEHDVPYAPLR